MPIEPNASPDGPMTDVDFAALAEFRYQLRLFLRTSEEAARRTGLEPQQHQLLLALRAASPDAEVTVGSLSERLQLKQHSVGGLIDRLEQRGFVSRSRSPGDRRVVQVGLTRKGEHVLDRLSREHIELLQSTDGLSRALKRLGQTGARRPGA